jgi:hypothetical protein
MKIDAYFDIAVSNAGEASQMTSCGILLILENEDDFRYRLLGFGLGWTEEDLAKIQAARLALAAVNQRCRKMPVILHLADDVVLDYLGEIGPNKYVDKIDELVRLCERFDDLGFSVESTDDKNIIVCRSLAEKIGISQQSYDSLTMDHIPNGQDEN